jgi:hypothetical protein
MYFIIGIAAVIVFLIGTSGIFLLAPGFALKGILTIGLGICCILGFQWLAPAFTSGGTRESVESDLKGLYDSAVDIGKSVEFDLLGNYRHNNWLNIQKEKHESGYFEDQNGLNYYNAQQDKEYYQRPDGRWQEMGLWNTPIDSPFEILAWYPVTAIDKLTGFWVGANIIDFPANVGTGSPSFKLHFDMTLKCNQNYANAGFKFNMENYLEALMTAYPSLYPSKESIWTIFANNSGKEQNSMVFGEYYFQIDQEDVPLDVILQIYNIEINNNGTKLKFTIPKELFSIIGTSSMECILDKNR